MKTFSTKRALFASVLSFLLCVTMLIGSTFAWFTDTATASVNTIKAGNLNIELQMKDNDGNWVPAEGKTLQFLVDGKIPTEGTEILWEPGCTYYVPEVRVYNKGNLAVKIEYLPEALGVTGALAEVLTPVFKTPVDENGKEVDIEPQVLKPGEFSPAWSFGYHMDEKAGNAYQNATASGIRLTVVATQAASEKDSNGNQYDVNADATIHVNSSNIQDYLDGKYGPINGMTLVLAEGNYEKIEFGRATAYEGSNTKYYLSDVESDPETIKQDIASHPNGGAGARRYVRYISDVTLKAADNATVTINGLVAYGGQVSSTKWYSKDFVVDRAMSATENNNISYWVGQQWNNITFAGLTFTDGVNIEAYGNKDTSIDTVTFDNCKFNVDDSANKMNCIRLNVDGNIGKANNLVVTNCEFTDGYTAILTDGMPNVTVMDSTFSGLARHAINPMMNELPNAPGYGKITVTGNTFKNMSSIAASATILRMGDVGANAEFVVKNNTATEGITLVNSIKVNSLADGITYNISGNDWGALTASDPRLNG